MMSTDENRQKIRKTSAGWTKGVQPGHYADGVAPCIGENDAIHQTFGACGVPVRGGTEGIDSGFFEVSRVSQQSVGKMPLKRLDIVFWILFLQVSCFRF